MPLGQSRLGSYEVEVLRGGKYLGLLGTKFVFLLSWVVRE